MTAPPNGSSRALQWTIGLLVTIAVVIVGGFVTWLSKLDDRTWLLNTHLSRIEEKVQSTNDSVKDIQMRLRDEEMRRREELDRHRFEDR